MSLRSVESSLSSLILAHLTIPSCVIFQDTVLSAAYDARRILRALSGTTHELWTGVCLWRRPDDMQLAWQEVSRVAMKTMSEAEVAAYLQSRTWQGCSGAYAIQEGDDPYVRVVGGSVSNVIGLPMETLERVLGWLARS